MSNFLLCVTLSLRALVAKKKNATKTPRYSRSLLNMLRISQGKPPYGAGKNTPIQSYLLTGQAKIHKKYLA